MGGAMMRSRVPQSVSIRAGLELRGPGDYLLRPRDIAMPPNESADVCAGLNKTTCCDKVAATDNTTKVCQYVVCNGTEACKPVGEVQSCPAGSNVTSPDTCPNATVSTTPAPTDTTQNTTKNVTTVVPTHSTTQTQDMCAGKNQADCCAVKDAQNVTLCQFMLCTGNTTGACFNKSKPLTDICGAAPATGVDQCTVTTPAPSPTTTANNGTTAGPTTQAPKCEDKTDNPACCAFKIGNVSCQWVNCTDATAPTKVHTGCHSPGENLTSVCVKDTKSNLCTGTTTTPSTPAPTSSTSTPKPTGGAQPSKGGQDQGRHFDGASFIGGIVLCAGLVAIAFFGLKFYRARTERNYHTLH